MFHAVAVASAAVAAVVVATTDKFKMAAESKAAVAQLLGLSF